MKIIDLLQMIANGEEDLPKKFKFDGEMFEMTEFGSYADRDGDSIFDSLCTDFSNINDEVEIIEEETEDSEIPNIDFDNMKDIGIKIGKAYRDFYEGLIEGWDNK